MVNFKGDTATMIQGFIGIIIAVVFLASVADSIFVQTNTFTLANETFTAGAVNVSTAITGRDLIGSGVVYNGSTLVPAANVTVTDGLVNGEKTVILTVIGTGQEAAADLNVSYTFGDSGYLSDSGSRSIALLIIIFGALAAVVFIIVMFLFKSEMGKAMMRR